MTRIDQLRTFHAQCLRDESIPSSLCTARRPTYFLAALQYCTPRRRSAFAGEPWNKGSRSLIVRATNIGLPASTQNTRLFTARPAHKSKEGWIVRTPTRAERKSFPGLHYSEMLEASIATCSFEQNLSTCGDAQFAVAYYILKFYTCLDLCIIMHNLFLIHL